MEKIQQNMIDPNKYAISNTMSEIGRIYKEFGIKAGNFKIKITHGRGDE